MKIILQLCFLYLFVFNFLCLGVHSQVTCESPQYIELGKTGTINCIFEENYFGIFWYNTSDYLRHEPVLHYQNFAKSGVGYTTGEFDVHPNGSLLITNATLEHDTTFKVVYVPSSAEKPIVVDILVTLVVRPKSPFPLIDSCGNSSHVCFSESDIPRIQCSVLRARPNVTLKLALRTVNGDFEVSTHNSLVPDGVGYTTIVSTRDVFHSSSLLALFVCKAFSPPGMLEMEESFILLQNGRGNLSVEGTEVRNIERYMELELTCTSDDVGFMVWKKATTSDVTVQEVLMYSVYIGEPITKMHSDDIIMGNNGALKIPRLEIKHEGLYFCLFGNGFLDGFATYEVVMIVPAYPTIEGCHQHHSCVLEGGRKGRLTCTVMNIRPLVELEWKSTHDSDVNGITFTNQRQTIKKNGDTFDVSLTSTYEAMDKSRQLVTIECAVVAPNTIMFGVKTEMNLVINAEVVSTIEPSLSKDRSKSVWIGVVVAFLLIVIFVASAVTIKICLGHRGKQNSKVTTEQTETEENVKMIAKDSTTKKVTFLKQLKETYRNVYSTVYPLPFRSDLRCNIDSEFVEVCLEFLDVYNSEEWKRLESYQGVFSDPRVNSRTRIIEGEPGYGKTTLACKFAYDWARSGSSSALRDVDILVCLQLRKLKDIRSIYKAIKTCLLPKDSPLSETDIQNIIEGTGEVVIILDGFDEYPHQLGDPAFDVLNIIAGDMFQDFVVLLTTRMSVLPKKYPPLTQKFRLTGFSESIRKCYIRKAVTGQDEKALESIERHIEQNPILKDLCQVPLIFVIVARMTKEREEFRQLYSVTSFFRYVISSFFSHMERKMDDFSVSKSELHQNNHRELDKVAFEALSSKEQCLSWEKTYLCDRIGENFYIQYKRIGILKEENDIEINDDPSSPINEHIQHKTTVTFFHKLFCEWYAAHYLAEYIKTNPSADVNELLQNLEPNDVHYLFRFACGLNLASEKQIVDYLMKRDACDQFAILCIMEQTGKIDRIKDHLRQLCFEGVIISTYDTLILQRSSKLLLEIASRQKIPIEYVCLHNCFNSVNESRTAIITDSHLSFSNTIAVKWLIIELSNKTLAGRNARHILTFSSKCDALKIIQFSSCVPPRSFKPGDTLRALELKEIQVRWVKHRNSPVYILNLKSGKWENMEDRTLVEKKEFKITRILNSDMRQRMTEESYKLSVQKTRDEMRNWGLKYSPQKNENENQ